MQSIDTWMPVMNFNIWLRNTTNSRISSPNDSFYKVSTCITVTVTIGYLRWACFLSTSAINCAEFRSANSWSSSERLLLIIDMLGCDAGVWLVEGMSRVWYGMSPEPWDEWEELDTLWLLLRLICWGSYNGWNTKHTCEYIHKQYRVNLITTKVIAGYVSYKNRYPICLSWVWSNWKMHHRF